MDQRGSFGVFSIKIFSAKNEEYEYRYLLVLYEEQ